MPTGWKPIPRKSVTYWKLLGDPQDTSRKEPLDAEDRLFLVNLSDDVGEQHNQARHHPETVARLKQLHEDWLAETKREEARPGHAGRFFC